MTLSMIFVGGPGRSGTSFTADRVGSHPDVATFKDVELKIFSEFGGLIDLQSVLVDRFSPNRAEIAFNTFDRMFRAICEGGYGQPALSKIVPLENLKAMKGGFFSRIRPKGHLVRANRADFNEATRDFVASLARFTFESKPEATKFLEKTPHNLLQPQFLHELSITARYLHIYRNPKAIATSLLNQSWGPSTLEKAAAWVQSYFDAWFDARDYYRRFDLPLDDRRIEDIAQDPVAASTEVCEHLGLSPKTDLFAGADIAELDKWITKLTSEDHSLLEERLGALCKRLGYPPQPGR